MPPLDWSLLFDGKHWFDPAPGKPTIYYLIILILFALALASSLFIQFYYVRWKFKDHALKRNISRTISFRMGLISLIGLVLLIFRYLGLPYLAARVWLYLTILVGFGFLGYLIRFMSKTYSVKVAEYDQRLLKQKYAHRPRAKGKVKKRT